MPYSADAWRYSAGVDVQPETYADVTTFATGLAWLLDGVPRKGTVEDWGCGMGLGRKLVHEMRPDVAYFGVDGSADAKLHGYSDVQVDLAALNGPEMPPPPDGLFMRHVLEHNDRWLLVLNNALVRFGKRMVLILFTPWSQTGLTVPLRGQDDPLLDISFKPADITAPMAGLDWHMIERETATQYGVEHEFRISRPTGAVGWGHE